MRKSGVLMHISSLPSPHGIGSMGKPARDFVDFLDKAGQAYWQILPVCPTSYGDSPYQSFQPLPVIHTLLIWMSFARPDTLKEKNMQVLTGKVNLTE